MSIFNRKKPSDGDIVAWRHKVDGHIYVTACYDKYSEPLFKRSWERVILIRAVDIRDAFEEALIFNRR